MKRNKKRASKCYIFIVIILFIFSSLTNQSIVATSLQESQSHSSTDTNISNQEALLSMRDTSQHSDLVHMPEAVNSSDYEKTGHINRLADREKDLYSLVFQNEDGTKTMYYYTEEVKYVDKNGDVRDKSNALTDDVDKSYKKNYKYCNEENDVRTFYPKTLSSDTGIVLEYDSVHIEQMPVFTKTSNRLSIAQKEKNTSDLSTAKETVNYAGAYGPGTEIRYAPTFSGFKEDLILAYYTGVNEFSFTLKTNGLHLSEQAGHYYLAKPGSDSPIVNIGDLRVYDSSKIAKDKTNYNHYFKVKTVRENEEYVITAVVDASYLKNENTVYPVTIDPSFEITSTSNGIMDISVDPSGTVTKSTALSAGYSQYYQKSFRTFIKFPGLLNSWRWAALAPYGFGNDEMPEITNLSLMLYNVPIDFQSTYIDAYQYAGSNAVTWSYSPNGTTPATFTTANYNAKGQFASGTEIDCAAGWKTIDLTNIDAFDLSKGIVLQNRYESSSYDYVFKQFYSTRNTTYKPQIVVTWRDISNTSFSTAKTATLNTNYNVSILESGIKHYYSFTPSATGFYTVESSEIVSGDPYGWLYNSSQAQLAYNDDGAGSRNFRMVYHLSAGKTYYIAAGCYSTGSGKYSFRITSNANMTYVSPVNTLAVGVAQSVNISAPCGRKYLKFTAPASKTYRFESSGNGTADPYGWLYNSNAVLLASNDDGAGSRNFRIECDLTAGQTVYLVAGCYGLGSGNYSVSVAPQPIIGQMSQDLNSDDYLSVPFAVSDTSNLNSIVFSISFNPNDFALADACELTSAPVLGTGLVAETNVIITEVSANKVSFKISPNASVPTGIVNIIKLKAKQTGTLTVDYSAVYSYDQ